MATYTVHQAKTNLSKLLAEMEAGGEVIIARGATPVARLVPVALLTETPRVFGKYKGQFTVGPEFFEDFTDEEIDEWDNESIFPEAGSTSEVMASGLAESPQSTIAGKDKP